MSQTRYVVAIPKELVDQLERDLTNRGASKESAEGTRDYINGKIGELFAAIYGVLKDIPAFEDKIPKLKILESQLVSVISTLPPMNPQQRKDFGREIIKNITSKFRDLGLF